MHIAATMIAICQLRIDSVLYERFRELALECSYPHQSQAVMGDRLNISELNILKVSELASCKFPSNIFVHSASFRILDLVT